MRPWPVPGNAGQGAINGAPAKGSDAVGGALMAPLQNVQVPQDYRRGRIHAPLASSRQRRPGRH